MSKEIKFYTLGCKVNQYETQAIREGFLKKQCQEAKNGKADIYVINTCTVTQSADRKSREHIYRCIRENPEATIVVTGCYVRKDRKQIAQISGVDFIVPNELKGRIADIVISREDKPHFVDERKYQDLKISSFSGHSRAFIKIQDGCNNNCSYCAIPLVRGVSRSRDLSSIIQEATRLIENGFKEIVLTGICLGAYGRDLNQDIDLADCLEQIEKIKGDFRIRLSSIEAKDISDRLIQKIADSSKLCRYLHIPFQSGDDEILKLMNRKYTAGYYKVLVEKARAHIPGISITTDIMVGFPQETEERFQNTVKFLKEVSPSRMHIFSFSPRSQTAAFSLTKRVDSKTTKKRLDLLQDLAREKSFEFRKMFLNKELIVLVEDDLNTFGDPAAFLQNARSGVALSVNTEVYHVENKIYRKQTPMPVCRTGRLAIGVDKCVDRRTRLAQGYSDNYIKIQIKYGDRGIATRKKLLRVKIIKVTPELTLAKLSKNP